MGFFEDVTPGGGGNAGECISGIDTGEFHDTFLSVVNAGWMLSIAGSRDGFSVAVTLFRDGKQVHRKYYTDAKLLDEAFNEIRQAATARQEASAADAKPNTARKARR